MISVDTETTGKDLRHGAQAFLITTCDESGDNEFWEFDVDPLTRRVIYEGDGKTTSDIPKVWLAQFRRKLRRAIAKGEWIVGQNISFDVLALSNTPGWDIEWPWHLTHDTLIAGHLLASNHPHDLTSMTLEYLGRDIQPYEDRAEEACKKARNLCRSQRPDWRIAKDGLPEMPSAKGKVWKYDLWIPRTVCLYAPELLPDESDKANKGNWSNDSHEHSWYDLTQDYANVDSLVTLELFKRQKGMLEHRGLWAIYEERRKLLQAIYAMEERGITISGRRLNALRETYKQEAATAENRCISLSGGKLEKLPKSGSSNALRDTLFSDLRLPVVTKSKKTGQPSVNKDVLEYWLGTLPERSKSYSFVRNLSDYRKRMTAISYMDGYERYWKPYRTGGTRFMDWFVLHPSVNETGTDTLRKSSSNPNEQNVSAKKGFNLRYAFGSAPGREWWSLDYENLELRLPAYESGEEDMIQLFERPNDPPYFGSYHLLIFSLLHPDKYDRNDPNGLLKAKETHEFWYKNTKNGNFATQYGAIEESGTADRAYKVKGAQRRIKDRFPKITALNDAQIAYAQKHGYVETMPDKEVDPKRGYPLLCPKNDQGRVKPTVPLNYHVQGTAGWVIMRAEIEAYEYLQRFNNGLPKPEYFLIIDVHDEMVLDLPRKANKANLPIVDGVRKIMERMGDCIGVPLTVGVEYHPDNWSEGETVRREAA